MQKRIEKSRGIILAAGSIMMVFASFPSLWSIFQAEAAAQYGITLDQSANLLPMCTGAFGIFYIISGRLSLKIDPMILTRIGSLMFSLAVINLWWLPYGTSAMKLYILFGFMFGGGCGLANPSMIIPATRWYAEKTGFAVGVINAVCSIIIFFVTYAINGLYSMLGFRQSLLVLGIFTGIVSQILCTFLVSPTDEYLEQKRLQALAQKSGAAEVSEKNLVDFTTGEMLRTKQFYILFLMAVFAMPAFSLMASRIVYIGESRGLSNTLAVSTVAIATGVSAVTKFLVPSASDKIGRKKCAVIFVILQLVSCLMLLNAKGIWVLIAYCLLMCAVGSWMTLIMPMMNDMYGFKYAASNTGCMNLYSTISSLGIPVITAVLTPLLGTNAPFMISIACSAVSVFLILILNMDTSGYKHN